MSIESSISPATTSPHLEATVGVCGGKIRIAGTRIRVHDIAIWHERMGLAADEIVSRYPQLTLAGVYAALAYYHDHREQIDGEMDDLRLLVEEMRRQFPSKLPSHANAKAE
jgi:uncharacterized protein (DUF433 family)